MKRTFSLDRLGAMKDRAHPQQIEIYRKMNSSQKLLLAQKMYWDARALREAAVKAFQPELTESEVRQKVKREFILARSD